MESNTPSNAQPPFSTTFQSQPPKPPRQYTGIESVFAWLCMLAGYLFCRAFPAGDHPMGAFLLILFLFAASTVVLKVKKIKLGALPIIAALSAVILSGALILNDNETIRFFSYAYALVIYFYYLYAATGNSLQKGLTDFIAIDFLKALLVMPFSALGHLFKAMFAGKAKKGGHILGKVLLGCFFAAVPTAIVMVLLSYDDGFVDLLNKILDFKDFDPFVPIRSILFGIPVAMFFYGGFIASLDKNRSNSLTEEGCKKTAARMKIAPALTVFVAVLPILFVYVVFFISQWDYYVSGFTGILPQNFSYAEYAREGFFQLCAVSVINLVIMAVVSIFMRRNNKGCSLLFKLLAIVFSLFTLVLISTALAKLVMYIQRYGLTPKRVHAAWFMLVLAVIFILIAIKQFAARIRLVAASLVVTVVMFAGLSLSNVDGFIAKYNVDRYVAGTLETVDVDAMRDLGLTAVPQMVRLAELLEEQDPLYRQTISYLSHINTWYFEEDPDLFAYTLPYWQAKQAIEPLFPEEE